MADIKILDLTTATEITETTDYIPVVDTSDTAQDSTGTTKKATVRKLLGDRVLPDTIVGTTETQTLTNKTLTSPVVTDVDITGGSVTDVDITGGSVSATTNVVEVLKKAYPIGSVYINASNATNPASLLGFGTWSAFGAGKVMVGLDAGDTSFDTAGETGGVKSVTLTSAQSGLPAHFHGNKVGGSAGGDSFFIGYTGGGITNSAGGGNKVPTQNNTAQNASEAHTNLQPYIVVYFWKRTA
jgi:hypothetical protein